MKPETVNNNPKSLSSYWKSIAVVAVVIPAVFWFRFKTVDGFAIAFTAFMILIMTAVQFLPGLNAKYKDEGPARNLSPSRFDRLGVVWLLSIPFAPFLSWVIAEFFTITAENWRMILGIKAGLCVFLPCVCVLPLTRFLQGKRAFIATIILVIGTCFPVIVGWNSMLDIIEGSIHREVVVTDVRPVIYYRNFKSIPTDIIEITLEDGSTLHANGKFISLTPGLRTLTILKNVDVVIGASVN